MKYLILFLISTAFWGTPPEPIIKWTTSTEHDFGDLMQGEPTSFAFQFKNISDQPIVIESVRPECGCTAPEWDFTPVPPDSLGTIMITYNAKKKGYFYKKVKVYFSGQRKAEKIFVEGFVEVE